MGLPRCYIGETKSRAPDKIGINSARRLQKFQKLFNGHSGGADEGA